MSTKQKEDTCPGGNVVTWDTWEHFDGSPSRFDFKIIDRKPMIVCPIAWHEVLWEKGKLLGGLDQTYQKRDCIVLEIDPKDPNYHYSKGVMYADKKTGLAYSTTWYDRKGEPWVWIWDAYRLDGNGIPVPGNNCYIDLKRDYAANPVIAYSRHNQCRESDYWDVENLKRTFPNR